MVAGPACSKLGTLNPTGWRANDSGLKYLSLENCPTLNLTRAPLGGGANIAPLPGFLDSSQTAEDIDAKLLVPSPTSI